jgi:hypothetical protein
MDIFQKQISSEGHALNSSDSQFTIRKSDGVMQTPDEDCFHRNREFC